MSATSIEFVVTGQSWSDTMRKGKVYTVTLKSEDGHVLKLKGKSSEIFKGYPKENTVIVELQNKQTTLQG